MWFERAAPEDRYKFMKKVLNAAKHDALVMIFPEGYCDNSTCVLRFRQACFDADIDIYPIAIKQQSRYGDMFWVSILNNLSRVNSVFSARIRSFSIYSGCSLHLEPFTMLPIFHQCDETRMRVLQRLPPEFNYWLRRKRIQGLFPMTAESSTSRENEKNSKRRYRNYWPANSFIRLQLHLFSPLQMLGFELPVYYCFFIKPNQL